MPRVRLTTAGHTAGGYRCLLYPVLQHQAAYASIRPHHVVARAGGCLVAPAGRSVARWPRDVRRLPRAASASRALTWFGPGSRRGRHGAGASIASGASFGREGALPPTSLAARGRNGGLRRGLTVFCLG
jgi:hypothetical protein